MRPLAPLLVVLVALSGCKRSAGPQELIVFAAASLQTAFAELGLAFERAHPDVTVRFAFAGSQALRTQIEHAADGAVDVFASADWRTIDALEASGRVEAPMTFARNEPVVVVRRNAQPALPDFDALPRVERLVLAAPEVPIGAYARTILQRASRTRGESFGATVLARLVSNELDTRQVLAKVALGEADAGIVYRTDVRPTDAVAVLTIPADALVLASYPAAVVTRSDTPAQARAFVDWLRGADAQAILRRHGFLPPDEAAR